MYSTTDFAEYSLFLSKDLFDVQIFTERINFLIENENLKLDLLIVINKLKTMLPETIFKFMCNYMSCKDGCYTIYILFKMLLNEKYSQIYFNYILKIKNFTKYIEDNTIYEILDQIYDFLNDDLLTEFMDIFDSNDNYEPLNLKNIDYLDENKNYIIKLLNIPHMNNIQRFIHNYHRLKIFYNLVYCLSHNTETNENNAKDDFRQRYILNIDKYIIYINYFQVIYYEDMSKKMNKQFVASTNEILYKYIEDDNQIQIHNDIPSNYSLKSHRSSSYKYIDGQHQYINTPIVEFTNEVKIRYSKELLWDIVYSLDEIFVHKFKYYLKYVIDYDNVYLNDKYHLNKFINNGPFKIGEKIQNHFKNQINKVRYIKYMNDVYESYLHYNSNKNCEFRLFLENICKSCKYNIDYKLVQSNFRLL
jgi:hypothetical protein